MIPPPKAAISPPDDDRKMAKSRFQIDVPAGTVLFREGEPGAEAFLIERGTIDIIADRVGTESLLGTRGPGELVGEMAILDSRPRTATCVAATDCVLLCLHREQFQTYLDSADPVVRMLLQTLMQRFRAILKRLKSEAPSDHELPMTIAEERGEIHFKALGQLKLEHDIRNAMDSDHFHMVFQPLVALADGRIAGFEALMRWRDPVKGMIYPDVFIPAAESSGLIVPLGRWSFRVSCYCLVAFKRAYAMADPDAARDLFMSINASGVEVMQADFLPHMTAALAETRLTTRDVSLEVTESMLFADPAQAKRQLEAITGDGMEVAIDDFGTGYSSLSYLHSFPFQKLKIDKAFVQSMAEDASSMEIVRTIIAMAHSLDMSVVAEGVETDQQLQILSGLGVQYGQGYLFSKPKPADEALDLLIHWQPPF